MDDKCDDENLEEALRASSDPAPFVVRHLRMMVSGTPPYQLFINVSPMIKNIWAAAADIIEHRERPTRLN